LAYFIQSIAIKWQWLDQSHCKIH